MAATTATKKPVIHFLRTYKFREEEKDPIIDRVHSCMEEVGASVMDVARGSGVSPTTLYNWFDGPTRRPQFATICAAIRSIGFDFAVVKSEHKVNGKPWDASMPPIIKRFRSAE